MYHAVEDAKRRDEWSLSSDVLSAFENRYLQLLDLGKEENPCPPASGKRGMTKNSKAGNLLIRLETHREAVTLFAHDFRVPFTNNMAERAFRFAKLKIK